MLYITLPPSPPPPYKLSGFIPADCHHNKICLALMKEAQ